MKRGEVLEVVDALFRHDCQTVFGNLIITKQIHRTDIDWYVRMVVVNDRLFITQNPGKNSKWGEMARQGHHVCWVKRDNKYVGMVIDTNIVVFKQRSEPTKRVIEHQAQMNLWASR